MVFFTTPELLEIGDIPMTSLNEKPVRTEALKYYRRVADHYELNIRQYERVDAIDGEDGDFRHACTDHARRRIPRAQNRARDGLLRRAEHAERSRRGSAPRSSTITRSRILITITTCWWSGAKNSAAIAALELHWTRRARDAGASRRGDFRPREILDQAEYRESHQERRDPRVFQSRVIEIQPKLGACSKRRRARSTLTQRFRFRHDRLPAGSGVSGVARHPLRSGNASAAHQSARRSKATARACIWRA